MEIPKLSRFLHLVRFYFPLPKHHVTSCASTRQCSGGTLPYLQLVVDPVDHTYRFRSAFTFRSPFAFFLLVSSLDLAFIFGFGLCELAGQTLSFVANHIPEILFFRHMPLLFFSVHLQNSLFSIKGRCVPKFVPHWRFASAVLPYHLRIRTKRCLCVPARGQARSA